MTDQKTCFMIQPLDDDYKKLSDNVFIPAIRAAGLSPYRVDQHYSGEKYKIDVIKEEIEKSAVCLADITQDNPNVWYEVGYAHGKGIPIVLLCKRDGRDNLPFDVNQRDVYFYDLTSQYGQGELKAEIVRRIKTDISNTEDRLRKLEVQRKDVVNIPKTLNNCQVAVLRCVLNYEENMYDYLKASVKNIHDSLPDYAQGEINLALHTLVRWGLVEQFGENSNIFETTDRATTWCEDNYDLLFPNEENKGLEDTVEALLRLFGGRNLVLSKK